MPQLNPEFFISQLFWLAVFFSILFIILWRISLPRISLVLEKRQNKIDENLSLAKELQEQAQGVEQKINDQISKAKIESNEKIKKTISSLQDDLSSKLLLLDKELEQKMLNSEEEIIKNRDEQMKNIKTEVASITKITVAKISDLQLSENDINQAIKSNEGNLN
tara:strand:+ start:75 stop:566 length:492 start_codon:yes stop_codon:yes gene_type:complete